MIIALLVVALVSHEFPCLGVTATEKDARPPLYIGGLFPIAENDRWFVPHVDVICQMAIDHVNAQSTLLPDFRLVLRMNDTRCQLGRAIRQMVQQLNDRDGKIVALLGAGCSSVTKPLASASHFWNLLQMTFLSSSPTLTNKESHPNLFQLIATENSLNPARVALMEHYGWTKAIVIYEAEEIFAYNAKHLMKGLQDASIDVVAMEAVTEDPLFSMEDALDRLKETKVRIIFGLFYEKMARKVICQASKRGFWSTKYTWILPGWYSSVTWYKDVKDVDCSVTNMTKTVGEYFTVDGAGADQYGMQNVSILTGRTGNEVEEEFRRRTGGAKMTNYLSYGYDSVLATAWMLRLAVMKLKSQNRLDLLTGFSYKDPKLVYLFKSILNEPSFEFAGLMGNTTLNLKSSNRRPNSQTIGRPQIIEVQYNSGNHSSLYAIYSNRDKTFQDTMIKDEFEKDKRLDFPMLEPMYHPITLFALMTSLAGVGILFALFLLWFNISYRKTEIIKLSSPRLNNLIILGGIMECLSVVFLGFNGQFFPFSSFSIISCHMHPVLLYGGFTLSFGPMLVKTWRVSKIIKWSVTKARPVSVGSLSDLSLFAIVAVFLLVDAIIFTIWFVLNPARESIDTISVTPDVEFQWHHCVCDTRHTWLYVTYGYKTLLLVFGGYLAFEVRKVKIAALNDSRWIGISIYNVAVVFVAIFIFSTSITNPSISYGLVAGSIILVSITTLCLVFVPKMCLVLNKSTNLIRDCSGGSNTESDISDHVITRQSDLNSLERKNRSFREIIIMLLEERFLCDETIERIAEVIGLPPPTGSRASSMKKPEINDENTVTTKTASSEGSDKDDSISISQLSGILV